MTKGKKLIEVALPLDGINKASVREKSILYEGRGHARLVPDRKAVGIGGARWLPMT